MEVPPLLIQFVGSLIAIIVIYWITRALGLGAKPKLTDQAAVCIAAEEIEAGFLPQRVSISREGAAALAKDSQGRIMVIKRHGNQFAGRVLTTAATTREEVDAIIVDPRETQFGAVRLSIDDAASWADAINRL